MEWIPQAKLLRKKPLRAPSLSAPVFMQLICQPSKLPELQIGRAPLRLKSLQKRQEDDLSLLQVAPRCETHSPESLRSWASNTRYLIGQRIRLVMESGELWK